MSKTAPFQTIQFSISTQFKSKYSLIVKNISISSYSVKSISSNSNNSVQHEYAVQFYGLKPIDRALSGTTIPGNNSNEGVLRIPQSCSITGTSQSDYLVSYQDTHWKVLPLCRDAIGVFYSPSQLGNAKLG